MRTRNFYHFNRAYLADIRGTASHVSRSKTRTSTILDLPADSNPQAETRPESFVFPHSVFPIIIIIIYLQWQAPYVSNPSIFPECPLCFQDFWSTSGKGTS